MSYMRTYRLGGSTRIKHDARTITLRGKDTHDKKERGRYVKCWNCRFICDTERDDLGGPSSRSGEGYEFYYLYYPQSSGSDRALTSGIEVYKEGMSGVSISLASYPVVRGHKRAMETGPDGSVLPIELTYASKSNGGCPFCSSRNYRGDFR